MPTQDHLTPDGSDEPGCRGRNRYRAVISSLKGSMRAWTLDGSLGSVAVLTAGVAIAQLITLAVSPLVARLFGPEAFGVLSVFVSVVAVIGGASTLSYALAVALPRRMMLAYQVLKLALAIAALLSVILALVIDLFGEPLIRMLGLNALAPFLWYLPAAVFLAAIVQALENWNIRNQQFRTVAGAAVLQAGAAGTARVAAGLLRPTAASLIQLSVLAQVVQACTLLLGARAALARCRGRGATSQRRRVAMLMVAARRYRGFPLFRTPQILLNVVSRSAPVVLLAVLFGPREAGLYSIAQTVVYLPIALISQPMGQVLLQRLSAEVNRGNAIVAVVYRHTIVLAAIGALPFGLIALLGPWVFGVVFGHEWLEAGDFGRWLAIWAYLNFVNVPAVQSLVVLEAQDVLLRWEIATTALKILILVAVGAQTGMPLLTVAAYSVFGAAAYVVLIVAGLARARRHERVRGI